MTTNSYKAAEDLIMTKKPSAKKPNREFGLSKQARFSLFAFPLPLVLLILLIGLRGIHEGFTFTYVAGLLLMLWMIIGVVISFKKQQEASSEVNRILSHQDVVPDHLIDGKKTPVDRLRLGVAYLSEKTVYHNRKTKEAVDRINFLETELERLHRKLDEGSQFDPMTGLLHRRFFEKELEKELARADRIGAPVTLALIKIDNLDEYAEIVGGQVAEEALLTSANIIAGSVRAIDLVFQYDRDTFALILPNAGKDGGNSAVARICLRIDSYRFPPIDDKSKKLNVLVGIATGVRNNLFPKKLISTAERVLKNSKKRTSAIP